MGTKEGTCPRCGKLIQKIYSTYEPGELCTMCDYWSHRIISDVPTKGMACGIAVVVNKIHSVIGFEDVVKSGRGSYGARFNILCFDENLYISTNVWCQGPVPEVWLPDFPNSATYVNQAAFEQLLTEEYVPLVNTSRGVRRATQEEIHAVVVPTRPGI